MKRLSAIALALAFMVLPLWSKPITVSGHYFEFATVACPAATTCSLGAGQFTPVPAGSQLIITQISCYITGTGTAKIAQVLAAAKLVAPNAPVRLVTLVPTLTATVGGGRQYSLNQQVLQPLQSKETPIILATFDQSTDITMGCSVSGDLIP